MIGSSAQLAPHTIGPGMIGTFAQLALHTIGPGMICTFAQLAQMVPSSRQEVLFCICHLFKLQIV